MKFSSQQRRRLFLILILLSGLSLSVFWLSKVFSENIQFYVTPEELVSAPDNRTLYVGGYVKKPSKKNNMLNFYLHTENNNQSKGIAVNYNGILPDLFRKNEFAIAIGYWNGVSLNANKVLAKHDENYQPPALK